MSQICAFNVFWSTWIDRVANSTPMVDLVSRLNSLRVKRESTAGELASDTFYPRPFHFCGLRRVHTYSYYKSRRRVLNLNIFKGIGDQRTIYRHQSLQ